MIKTQLICFLHYTAMFSFLCFMLFSYTNLVTTQTLSRNNTLQTKSIFILAGQSNMAGRGGVTNRTWNGIIPVQCRADPRIIRLSSACEWEEAWEPLHVDIDVNKTCGVGPGMAFSHYILKKDKGIGVIGLVPCAIGGTNITEWRSGSDLYNMMMVRARAAVSDGGGLIKGILWYQGETDTKTVEDSRLYKRRLEKFFTDVRSDLRSPMLPLIQVALASGEGSYVDIIRRAQMEIDLPNLRTVDAMGLELEADGLHLTTASQVQLGRKLANAFLRIMAPLPVQSSASRRFCRSFLEFLPRWFRQIVRNMIA